MRFHEGGPSIPDELLVARDEGRVVFFCGAGISVARAELPDFPGLAQRVLLALEGTADSPSKRLMETAREVERTTGVRGLIPADRVFSILERDFEISDVHAEVAKALKPPAPADLSAHRILLDLARGPDGRTRLVTTNFERLFEEADGKLESWTPDRLPNPQNPASLDGIIHLHGRVNQDYSGAEGDGFVLSSAEFGRAYISQGWATRFIASILRKYLVVFVGYTADDPPVQYLLEALNREPGSHSGLFAFQAGSHSEAEARWIHKGVQPIPYDDRDRHKALWECLEAWAARARNVDAWYETVIAAAHKGPATLSPHERGQVKHVVSTLDGARRFALANKPPPAEWLCVFDRASRFAPPGQAYSDREEKTVIDPFELYGLDSDPVPATGEPDDLILRREIPKEAWHCFELTRLDRDALSPEYFSALHGIGVAQAAPPAPRLAQLGIWISKVSEQPATVWWASGRGGLHPNIKIIIRSHLNRTADPIPATTRKAWEYLFEAWKASEDPTRRALYELRGSVKLDGWTASAVRQFAALHRPYFSAKRPITHGPRPPAPSDDLRLHDVVRLDVEYPDLEAASEIPDELLRVAVRAWREVLENAVLMENELNPYALDRFVPLVKDENDHDTHHVHGVSIPITYYLKLLERLVRLEPDSAREECAAWWKDDDHIFARLRIWASGEQALFAGDELGAMLQGLSDRAFWRHGHQRDLLLVLARRWANFTAEARDRLCDRLRAGPARRKDEDEALYSERRAWASLERIHWLKSRGCDLGFDVDQVTSQLAPLAPRWKPEFAPSAVDSWAMRVGSVSTDSEYAELLSLPLADVLARAKEVAGERARVDVQKDPFGGLAKARPIRALSALILAHKSGEHPTWAWKTFLNAQAQANQLRKGQARSKREIRFLRLVGERLARLPIPVLSETIHSVAEWLLSATEQSPVEVQELDTLWPRVIAALRDAASRPRAAAREKEPDWATEALNSPTGKLALALMADTRKAEAIPGEGFPNGWLDRADALLSLGDDARRHALAIFTHNLNWFYAKDPEWTERHLLVALADELDAKAFWAGVLWSARIPQEGLYLRLKPALLRLERQVWVSRHSHLEVVAAYLLGGWRGTESGADKKFISNDEMRTLLVNASDDFRSQLLWQLERWSEDPEGGWTPSVVRAFLIDAWPRQKVVKTARTSARLCELAFSSVEIFEVIADIVTALMTTTDDTQLSLIEFTQSPEKIVDKYPERTLALLCRVLSNDVRKWPYGIEAVLDRIVIAQPKLVTDVRFVELRRRWNAR